MIRTIWIELGKAASPRAGRWLLIASGVVGLLSALIVALATPTQDRTFAMTSFYVPKHHFPAVTLRQHPADDARLGRRALSRSSVPINSVGRMVRAKLVASMIIAVVAAGYGIVLSGLATSLPPSTTEERWQGIGVIMLGSVLVQLIAQLCGAGLGLLLMSSAAAIVADVLVPLSLWVVGGAIPGLKGLQAWLTPFASVGNLLSGHMDAQRWAQVGVVVVVWVIALNAAGILRVRRMIKASLGSAYVQ